MRKTTTESIRIFKNPILESFTHVHPIIPLVLWLPVIVAFLYIGIAWRHLTSLPLLLLFFAGIIVWTLTEYTLHRFVFHWDAKSDWGKYFVFLFHGLHHDAPQDATRLVMPPVPAILIVLVLFHFFKFLLVLMGMPQYHEAFMAFFLIGYLCYDYTHYATHHFPMTSPIGKYLRKYHLQHHFSHEDAKYGVSSPIWDYVFGTVNPKKINK